MIVDYHLHSDFSMDCHESMENQILRAIELGLTEMCFTEHVDYGIKKDWGEENIVIRTFGNGESEMLVNADYPHYFAKLNELREKYQGQIVIKAGLEFGVQTHTIERYQDLIQKYQNELDFILLSIHQVDNKEFWNQDFQQGKTLDEIYSAYYSELLNVVKNYDGYDVLAHLDLISRYVDEKDFPFEKIEGYLSEIFKILIDKKKGIEINTSSWHYGLSDTTPSRKILKLYYQMGGRIITIGSDAHSTKYLADHFGDAISVLKEIGFDEISTYHHRTRSSFKI